MCSLTLTITLLTISSGCILLASVKQLQPAEKIGLRVTPASDKAKAYANFARGMLLLADNKLRKAEESFLEAAKFDPTSSRILLRLTSVQARIGKLDEAKRNCLQASELDPDNPEVHRTLSNVYVRMGQLAEAAVEMTVAIELEPDNPTNYTDLAAIYYRDKKEPEAVKVYRMLVEARRNDPKARVLLARALEKAGKLDEAQSELEKVIELAPMNLSSYTNKALFEMRRGRPDDAIQVYRDAIARISEPGAYLLLGGLYERLERVNEAVETYRAALELDPNEPSVYIALANLYEKKNDMTEAVDIYLAGLQNMPDDLRLRYGLASAYVQARNRPAAIAEFTRVVELYRRAAEAHYSLGVLYQADEDYPKAAKHLRLALSLSPKLAAARRYLASTLAKRGDLAGAIAEYRRLITNDSGTKDSEALALLYFMAGLPQKCIRQLNTSADSEGRTTLTSLLLGKCYVELGKAELKKDNWSQIGEIDEAGLEGLMEVIYLVDEKQAAEALIPALEEAALSGANEGTCHIVVGEIRATIEDTEGAVKAYKRALGVSPESSLAHFQLGALYEEMDDYEAAAYHFTRCLTAEPNNARACNYLGYMYAEQGTNLDEAEQLIKRALEIESKNGYYLDSLGWVYYKQGDMQKAIELLLMAVEYLDHDDAIVRDHLGDAYYGILDVQKALTEWRKASRLDPENETIKEKLRKHGAGDSET